MNIRRGAVVLVDFPFSDRTGSRVRPALVVQADDLNRTLNATMLAMITSSSRRVVGHPSQLLIEATHPEFPQSGLRTDSLIQCNQLSTLRQDLILKTLGHLSSGLMDRVNNCLKAAFAIP